MISADPSTQTTSLTLRDLGDALRRGKYVLLGVTAATIVLAGILTLVLPPTYESQTSVQILRQDEAAGQFLAELGPLAALGLPGLGDSEIDTDMSVLRSRRIVGAVVDSLALHVRVEEPEGNRDEILLIEGGAADAVPGSYTLRRQSDGSYVLRSARVRTADGKYTRSEAAVRQLARPPERIRIGQQFEMAGMRLTLVPDLAADPPSEVRLRVRPFQEFVQRVREKDLRVRRPDRGQVVLAEYRYHDAELAAAAVNALAHHFIDYKLSTSTTDSRNRVQVLREQTESYERQIREVEQALQRFQEQELIIAPEEQATQQVRRVAELQVARDAAVMERQALASVLAEVASSPPANDPGASPYRRLATFPSFIANGAIQDLLQALIELEDSRAELLILRQPNNQDVVALTTRIEELELQLLRLAQNYLASLDSQIASADSSLSRFATELAAMPSREIEYARLTRERMLLSEVYLTLQERLKEAEVLQALEMATGSVRVLDPGLVPERPIFPNPAVNLSLAAVLGLMLGVMVVIARESMSTRIRSRADAESAGIGAPVLGAIPRFAGRNRLNGVRAGGRLRLPGGTDRAVGNGAGALVARELPASPASDAFRALRTSLALSHRAPPRLVVITSPARGEGKSVSASNLAITLAQQGSRTLLIDGDLRTGRLHEVFGVARRPGLVDVLTAAVPLQQALREIDVGGTGEPLHVLPSGDPPANPPDLLGSDEVGRLFAALRESYDSIIVDSPAMEAVADAALLGSLADATILVIRAGATERDALADAVAQLRRLRVNVGGVVVNEG